MTIERTFRSRRKNFQLEERGAKAEEASLMMPGGGDDQTRTLWDFVIRGVQGIAFSIAWLNIEAHNFEVKSTLISMVQQSQFGGTSLEDPHLYLSVFLEMCDALELIGVSTDAIKLLLFPFSLRYKAREWLHCLALGCIRMWDELIKVFLAKFFPLSKITWETKSPLLLKERTNRCMKPGSDLRTYWGYVRIIAFNDGC